mmetsp:Transcript_7035/g.23919  ORF Transcript_7035/g.23919 Transcript_7035/m.23919 type:complete len:91 (-) Transcript_7035:169-441(-)
MDASAEDFTHAVRVIVQHFGGDVNDVQGDGETLLHKAAAAGNTSMGAALLAAGSVDRAEGGGGNFALHRAVSSLSETWTHRRRTSPTRCA